MTIYVAFSLTEDEQATLREATLPADEWLMQQHLPEDQRFEAFSRAEVAFGNVPLDWVEKSGRLRWIQLYSAGIDPYQQLRTDERSSPLAITNLRNFFGQPVAETAVGGILALDRKLDELTRLQGRAQWVGGALRPQMRLLHGRSVLLLGAGAIGTAIRKLLEAFSCPVRVVSRSASLTLDDLDRLLPQADILVSCLPETNETKGLLDARRLAMMKSTALLVNVGRGSLVDEAALIEALRGGKLGGAVLDVSQTEPLAADHPLWTCPNALLTQHTGGGYDAENADKVRVFTENLRRYRANEPLLNVVDFSRGY